MMHKPRPRIARIASLIAAAGTVAFGGPAQAQETKEFGWSITPYLWASHTTLDLSLNDNNLGGAAVSFGDLLDVLDTAIQLNVETGGGKWTGFVDFTYIETSDGDQRAFQPGSFLQIDSESTLVAIDAAAAFWPAGVGTPLSLYGGLRYSDFDDRFRFSLAGNQLTQRRSSEDYYDALIGARYRFDLSERWSLLTRGDLSFGDSEGTWMLSGLFSYTVGKRQMNRILFGYQYKEGEFRDGNLTRDYVWQGPLAGFSFRF